MTTEYIAYVLLLEQNHKQYPNVNQLHLSMTTNVRIYAYRLIAHSII